MYDQSTTELPVTHIVTLTTIRKRNGSEVPFKAEKITRAIHEAARATGEFGRREARMLTIRVLSLAQAVLAQATPEVEEIQDAV